ncbi:ACP S-malonyltransferase [Oscillatoria sp. CS-180]|uniref:ACP S-malonyltransferase n=1 Tax=Oscillatoria sp. CS-180 TaxID=3021720 RepID=UPI00232AC78B|nr:ACP S-malonyltransferase [Oscillatoria sp. CS-180]MDB9528830.1 ACP S-malonyltransferase [Oscillatoria sp. CS-180]
MVKTAWVFPGQGSQSVGMGIDLMDLPLAKERLAIADDVLGWSVSGVCQSEDNKVSNTLYTQPCLYVVESVLIDLLKERGQTPDLVAGHSLGEYCALYAAEAFDFTAGLRLVKLRAELMSQTSEGIMAAIIGFDREALETKIAETEGVVLANDNNPSQVVISGTPEAVDAVLTTVKSKRAVKLKVSGAFHSPIMGPAAREFQEVLDAVEFQPVVVPVLSNVDPTPMMDSAMLKERLSRQMTGSVRWREISLALPEQGIERVIEVGPGNVLTGLMKRTVKTLTLVNVGTLNQLQTL